MHYGKCCCVLLQYPDRLKRQYSIEKIRNLVHTILNKVSRLLPEQSFVLASTNPRVKALRKVLVECRRILNLVFIPWVGILLICLLASWYSLFVVGLDALLAPVIKAWLFLKPFLIKVSKVLPAFLLWIWLHTGAKLSSWFGEIFVAVFGYLGGWKAWSFKKLLRQAARFFVTFTARFVVISVVLNLLFGRERKGVKRVPALLATKLRSSSLGRLINLWETSTERQKRLVLGIFLCVVLVIAGHALLGFSILLFDLIWELVLVIARWLVRLWRFLLPIVMRFVPNFIGSFVTRKLVPLFANVVPIIKDDHRVMYLRFDLRQRYRNFKSFLYRKSRARRPGVRGSVRPYISERVRTSKGNLIDAAASLRDSSRQKPGDT